MPGVPLDAMDQVKKAFKGFFKKKPKKDDTAPLATDVASPAHGQPSQTTPVAPTPAQASEPSKTESPPAIGATGPILAVEPTQSVAVPDVSKLKKDEAPASTEAGKATDTLEPAGASASPPPTVTVAHTPTRNFDVETEATEGPASTMGEPSRTTATGISATTLTDKPAAGMSATSGPMSGDPNFDPGSKKELESTSETPATGVSTIASPAAPTDAPSGTLNTQPICIEK